MGSINKEITIELCGNFKCYLLFTGTLVKAKEVFVLDLLKNVDDAVLTLIFCCQLVARGGEAVCYKIF